MLRLLVASTRGLLRVVAVAGLALFAAVNLLGLVFVAYAWLMDADIRVKGGAVTLAIGFATLFLCVKGIRALVHPRASTGS